MATSEGCGPGMSTPCQNPIVAKRLVASSSANDASRVARDRRPAGAPGWRPRRDRTADQLERPPRREQGERPAARGLDRARRALRHRDLGGGVTALGQVGRHVEQGVVPVVERRRDLEAHAARRIEAQAVLQAASASWRSRGPRSPRPTAARGAARRRSGHARGVIARSVPSTKTRSSPPGSRRRTRSPRRWTAAPRGRPAARSALGPASCRGATSRRADVLVGRRARVASSGSPAISPRSRRSARTAASRTADWASSSAMLRRVRRAARARQAPTLRSRAALSSTPRLLDSCASSSWASSKTTTSWAGSSVRPVEQVRAVEGGVHDDDVGVLGGGASRASAKHVAPWGHRSAPGHSSAGIETRDHARGVGLEPEVVALAGRRGLAHTAMRRSWSATLAGASLVEPERRAPGVPRSLEALAGRGSSAGPSAPPR